MKFIYSVIGDNTAENREWLEKIGYKRDDINNGDTSCFGLRCISLTNGMRCPIIRSGKSQRHAETDIRVSHKRLLTGGHIGYIKTLGNVK